MGQRREGTPWPVACRTRARHSGARTKMQMPSAGTGARASLEIGGTNEERHPNNYYSHTSGTGHRFGALVALGRRLRASPRLGRSLFGLRARVPKQGHKYSSQACVQGIEPIHEVCHLD